MMMKICNRLVVMFLLLNVFAFTACSQSKDDEPVTVQTQKVPLGDPFILLYNNTYYAYGTFAEGGIAVFESDDLKTWSVPAGVPSGLALKRGDVWGTQNYWAPEVYNINGTFYMYYTAEEHICVATSSSPLGPFTQTVKKPIIESEKCIDASLFIDNDGKAYLSFVRFTDGNNIWMAELDASLTEIKPETMHACIHVSQAWEQVMGRVNEGSFIIKHNGLYYMTYSANDYQSHLYGVGCATVTSIIGEWTKYADNPILQKPGELVGVGHSAMFTGKDGQLKIVFHAHRSNEAIHPRFMCTANVSFVNVDGVDKMVVDTNYTIAELKSK